MSEYPSSTDQPGPHDKPPGAAPEGLLETAVSVITSPVPTLRRLTRERRVAWAIILTVAISAVVAVVSSATGGVGQFDLKGIDLEGAERAVGAASLVGAAIFGPIVGLIALAVGTGIFHLVSLALGGGAGSYTGLFVAFAFAQVPYLFRVPVDVLAVPLGSGGAALSAVVQLALVVWVLALWVIAIRENYAFTTGRAVAALLIPLAVLAALTLALIIVIAVALFGALATFFG